MPDDTLTRRETLTLIGAGAVGLACGGTEGSPDGGVLADAPPGSDTLATDAFVPDAPPSLDAGTSLTPADFGDAACILTPSQGSGPYYYPVELDRLDIREGKPGALLRFGVRVVDADCNPLPGLIVDLWQCDALGVYAGFPGADPDEPPPGGLVADESEIFCRGVRPTDTNGISEFLTIYPGWYSVRTAHIHLKVVLDRSTIVTTQAYFDDDYTNMVYTGAPYAERPDRQTFNPMDGGFDTDTLIDVRADGAGHLGTLTLSINI